MAKIDQNAIYYNKTKAVPLTMKMPLFDNITRGSVYRWHQKDQKSRSSGGGAAASKSGSVLLADSADKQPLREGQLLV